MSESSADALEEIRIMTEGLSKDKSLSETLGNVTGQDTSVENEGTIGGNMDLKI